MNCGLGNLDSLKKHLLAGTMSTNTDFDGIIADLGRGVAASFEKYCNRKFFRQANDQYVVSADRDHAYVPRYPMEQFTSIELKADITVGWELQTGLVLNVNNESGLVYWGAGISFQWAQMRITYTGGFWWETLEPDDDAYPSQMPAGATPLPDDLRLAWLLQCRHVWSKLDKTGTDLLKTGDDKAVLSDTKFFPGVESTLQQYRRYAML